MCDASRASARNALAVIAAEQHARRIWKVGTMRNAFLLILAVLGWSNSSMAQHVVEGTWEWECSILGSGDVINPATEGHTRQLFFGEEPDRVYIEYRNEIVLCCGTWGYSHVWIGDECHEILGAWDDTGAFYFQCFPEYPDPDTIVLAGAVEEHFVRRGPVSSDAASWGELKKLYR